MKLVQAHGCFDILHIGHVRHLEAARACGDRLVVTITGDKHITKGKGRPVFNELQRREVLMALRFVDYVMIIDAPDAETAIRAVRPNVYVKGAEYASNCPEADLVLELGGIVVFTGARMHSSTKLVGKI